MTCQLPIRVTKSERLADGSCRVSFGIDYSNPRYILSQWGGWLKTLPRLSAKIWPRAIWYWVRLTWRALCGAREIADFEDILA